MRAFNERKMRILITLLFAFTALSAFEVKAQETGLDVIPNANKEYKRWPKEAIKEFLPLLTDFYLKSNFSEFYRLHSQMYKNAVDAARITMADYVDLDWFCSFFKKEATADFGIIVGLNNGSGSFGIERTKPGERPEKIEMKKGTEQCPAFWKEFSEQLCIPMMQAGKPLDDKQAAVAENNIGEYALCDCDMESGTFDYFISGSYKGGNVPEGMEVRKVEYKRWLKFHFEGGMAAFHNNYTYIYNEWLPQHPEYKAVMEVNVEWYTMGDFNSPDYQCGLMVPVLDNSQKN